MFSLIVLTLYVDGTSLYFALMRVPGVVGIRAVTRSILVLLLPFSIALVQVVHLCVDKLQKTKKPLRFVLPVVAVVVLVAENYTTPYRFSKAEAKERVRALGDQLPAKGPGDAILAYVHPTDGLERHPYELDAMLLAQDKGMFTMNGYSSRMPKGYRLLRTCADLKLVLNNTAQQDETFHLRDPQKQIVVLGTPLDAPCVHLNAPASIQTEPLPDNAFRAKLELHAVSKAPANSGLVARVLVTNDSDVLWRVMALPTGKYAVRVGCRWVDSSSQRPLSGYDNRFDFPYDIYPRAVVSTVVAVLAPSVAGSYELECDVVQEVVHWFHDMGSQPGRSKISISEAAAPHSFEGFLDRVDNLHIAGWAWDENQPNSPIRVSIYEENTLLTTILANLFREDLLKARKGNGVHGFAVSNPVNPNNETVHRIRAFVAGTNVELNGSPRTLKTNR
jgi:hypothetical protein